MSKIIRFLCYSPFVIIAVVVSVGSILEAPYIMVPFFIWFGGVYWLHHKGIEKQKAEREAENANTNALWKSMSDELQRDLRVLMAEKKGEPNGPSS